jgi:hypothetical protein
MVRFHMMSAIRAATVSKVAVLQWQQELPLLSHRAPLSFLELQLKIATLNFHILPPGPKKHVQLKRTSVDYQMQLGMSRSAAFASVACLTCRSTRTPTRAKGFAIVLALVGTLRPYGLRRRLTLR